MHVLNSQPNILYAKKLHVRYKSKLEIDTREGVPYLCAMMVTAACDSM